MKVSCIFRATCISLPTLTGQQCYNLFCSLCTFTNNLIFFMSAPCFHKSIIVMVTTSTQQDPFDRRDRRNIFHCTGIRMKTSQYKARILFVGPCNGGKSKLTNYLADMNIELPEDLRPTKGLRIVEYDLNNVQVNGANANVDVQIWDTSGDEKYMAFWSVFRKNTDGVVFVYNQEDDVGVKKLDYMYNYFVSQPNISLRTCLVCCVQSEEVNAKLPSTFSKISQITVNLENQGEKFKQDFSKYVLSVVNTIVNK